MRPAANMSTPTSDPALPVVLDPVALARLHDLDPDGSHAVVSRVLGAFETSLARMLGQLEAGRVDGDVAAVARVAHTLKSSSASVGALALSAACADVEARLRGGDGATLLRDIDHLLTHGRAALVAVAAMLKA